MALVPRFLLLFSSYSLISTTVVLESPGMNTWGLCIGDDCLELLQQVALPGRKMGDFVFDRSRAMNKQPM